VVKPAAELQIGVFVKFNISRADATLRNDVGVEELGKVDKMFCQECHLFGSPYEKLKLLPSIAMHSLRPPSKQRHEVRLGMFGEARDERLSSCSQKTCREKI